jgi:hypothetical protein
MAEEACSDPPMTMTDCLPGPVGLAGMVPDLDILKTPSSPALAAVGGMPVDIERPTTATSAAASLATGIVHGLFVPGTTTAIEVMPYWLAPHPFLTASGLESTRARAFLRDLAFSFAASPGADPARPVTGTAMTTTTPLEAADVVKDAGLVALGVRTTIWPGRPSEAALACMARITAFMKEDVDLRNTEDAAFEEAWKKNHPPQERIQLPQPDDVTDEGAMARWNADMQAVNGAVTAKYKADHQAALAQWLTSWNASHPEPDDVAACTTIIDHRVGPVAALAASLLVSAPGGEFTRFRQGGTLGETAWLTAGYSWLFTARIPWTGSVLGALRLRHQSLIDTSERTSATDVGVRAAAAFGRWGLSVQGMRLGSGASGFGTGGSWQGGLAIDYHLKSGYWLTATAGSADLAGIDSWATATALVSLQYNVGRDRRIQPDTSPVAPAARASSP